MRATRHYGDVTCSHKSESVSLSRNPCLSFIQRSLRIISAIGDDWGRSKSRCSLWAFCPRAMCAFDDYLSSARMAYGLFFPLSRHTARLIAPVRHRACGSSGPPSSLRVTAVFNMSGPPLKNRTSRRAMGAACFAFTSRAAGHLLRILVSAPHRLLCAPTLRCMSWRAKASAWGWSAARVSASPASHRIWRVLAEPVLRFCLWPALLRAPAAGAPRL